MIIIKVQAEKKPVNNGNLSNRIAKIIPSVLESIKESPKKKYGPPMPEDNFSCDTYQQTEKKQY